MVTNTAFFNDWKGKWYVGAFGNNYKYKAFRSDFTPTEKSHGTIYKYVIGPFKTMRGAKWAERYGQGNPHFRYVSDAERISKV